MKSVFIASSRKFYDETEKLVNGLKSERISTSTAGTWDKSKPDNLKDEKKAILEAFKQIDKKEIIYIYAKEGYIGKTVSMEIAYAHARNKTIISSEKVQELSAQALISKVLTPKELMIYCK